MPCSLHSSTFCILLSALVLTYDRKGMERDWRCVFEQKRWKMCIRTKMEDVYSNREIWDVHSNREMEDVYSNIEKTKTSKHCPKRSCCRNSQQRRRINISRDSRLSKTSLKQFQCRVACSRSPFDWNCEEVAATAENNPNWEVTRLEILHTFDAAKQKCEPWMK